MRLIITSDRHQFVLNKVRKKNGEEVLDAIGYYASIKGLADGIATACLRSKVRKWTPEQFLGALESFKAETVKLENRCTPSS